MKKKPTEIDKTYFIDNDIFPIEVLVTFTKDVCDDDSTASGLTYTSDRTTVVPIRVTLHPDGCDSDIAHECVHIVNLGLEQIGYDNSDRSNDEIDAHLVGYYFEKIYELKKNLQRDGKDK